MSIIIKINIKSNKKKVGPGKNKFGLCELGRPPRRLGPVLITFVKQTGSGFFYLFKLSRFV